MAARRRVELAEALRDLYDEPERRRRLACAAAVDVERFAWPRVATQVLTAYVILSDHPLATGGASGPARSGRAVRASLVAIMVLEFVMTVTLWGLRPTFVFKG